MPAMVCVKFVNFLASDIYQFSPHLSKPFDIKRNFLIIIPFKKHLTADWK